MSTTQMSGAKQLARDKVHGVWVAIPTPFTDDGSRVDEDRLARSVDHYVDALKVDGIFCGGVMGEFWALSIRERETVHELVAERVDGRVPVMAQVGHHALADTVRLCDHAESNGIDFGIAMNPYYPPALPDELVRNWYERLAEASRLPMFLFNTPYSGSRLSPELIADLADLDNICGIKNPQGREHLMKVQELVGDRIVVADASERDWLQLYLEHGFQALMSTPALALFQTAGHTPVADYTRCARAGDLDAAWEIQGGLEQERDLFDRWMRKPWLEQRIVPIAQLKAWLELLGLPQGPVRAPLTPLTSEQHSQLSRDVERLELGRG